MNTPSSRWSSFIYGPSIRNIQTWTTTPTGGMTHGMILGITHIIPGIHPTTHTITNINAVMRINYAQKTTVTRSN